MKEYEVEYRHDTTLRVRLPSSLVALVDDTARRHMTTASAFTRAALIAALEAEGVAPEPIASHMKRREREKVPA